uniref:Neur_chan_LBD domain-containing protein n=1 Tax=Macrostomum lignano TaxID=282301 RepID=A0A1I8GLY6_9PLAT
MRTQQYSDLCCRLCVAVLVLLSSGVHSQTEEAASGEEQVIRWLNLTARYCKEAAPPQDNGTATLVTVDCLVNELLEVQWTDRRLAWDRSGNAELLTTDEIFLPLDMIWVPDVIVMRPIDIRSFEKNRLLAKVLANGQVTALLSYGTTNKCKMKLNDFPFDSQHCSIYLSSVAKGSKYIRLKALPRPNDQQIVVTASQNNEFCVTNVNTSWNSKMGQHDIVNITVSFKRRPLYYVIVLIIPSALILATCIFGFLLPADSGDRLALNVAILLSMSVFLQLAGSITPAQSESVPVLTWYFTVAMAVTALSTIGSIVVHLCYRRAASREAVSSPVLRLLFLNRLCGWKNTVQSVENCKESNQAQSLESVSMTTIKTSPGSEWQQIGSAIDRLLIICSVSCSVAVLLLIFVTAVKNASSWCPTY